MGWCSEHSITGGIQWSREPGTQSRAVFRILKWIPLKICAGKDKLCKVSDLECVFLVHSNYFKSHLCVLDVTQTHTNARCVWWGSDGQDYGSLIDHILNRQIKIKTCQVRTWVVSSNIYFSADFWNAIFKVKFRKESWHYFRFHRIFSFFFC